MEKARLRPRCRYVSVLSPQAVLEKIKKALLQDSHDLQGQVVQEHAFIRFPEEKQHYWSPELHVWARDQEGETIIYGVMGPKPKIWTMFVFFYTAVITLTFLGGSYGFIQLWLDMEAPFLWSVPGGIVGALLIYGAARYGQYKGREQMEELQEFLETAVQT
jgi:hypothetical protein